MWFLIKDLHPDSTLDSWWWFGSFELQCEMAFSECLVPSPQMYAPDWCLHKELPPHPTIEHEGRKVVKIQRITRLLLSELCTWPLFRVMETTNFSLQPPPSLVVGSLLSPQSQLWIELLLINPPSIVLKKRIRPKTTDHFMLSDWSRVAECILVTKARRAQVGKTRMRRMFMQYKRRECSGEWYKNMTLC